MLLLFSIPIVLLITLQAFLSRAHANWAAVAYVAASVLVTATMLRDNAKWAMRGSFALHLTVLTAIAIGGMAAGRIVWPMIKDPYRRVLGWSEVMAATRKELNRGSYGALVATDRAVAAQALYYLRDMDIPIAAWRPGPIPHDHFQLTRPFSEKTPGPILLVGRKKPAPDMLAAFTTAMQIGEVSAPAGQSGFRTLWLTRLEGLRTKAP